MDDPDWLERELQERWRRKEEAYARADAIAGLIFGLMLMLPFIPFAIIGLIAGIQGASQ